MSLTGPVPEEQYAAVGNRLAELFADSLVEPVMLDALTIFMEEVSEAGFVALSRAELGAPAP
jgi:hypothetical protein